MARRMTASETRDLLVHGTRTADRAEEFGTRNAVPGEVLIRVTPHRTIAVTDVAGY
jgi:hypothetical protein